MNRTGIVFPLVKLFTLFHIDQRRRETAAFTTSTDSATTTGLEQHLWPTDIEAKVVLGYNARSVWS